MTSHMATDHPCHDAIVIAAFGPPPGASRMQRGDEIGIEIRCGNCGISQPMDPHEIALPELVAWLDDHCEDQAASRA